VVTYTAIWLPHGGTPSETLAGDLFVGDQLSVIMEARDAQGLRALIWEVPQQGVTDSQIVVGPFAGVGFFRDLTPAWVGEIGVRFYARDSRGLASEVVFSAPGALNVHPTVSRPTVTRSFAAETREVAIDALRGRAYLLHANQRQVEIIQLSTITTVGIITLPAISSDLDLTVSGDSLVLAYPSLGALGVVDLALPDPSPVTVPITPLDQALRQAPVYLRALAHGKVFVTLEGDTPEAFRLLEVDPRTGIGQVRMDAGSGGYIQGGIERADDGSAAVVGAGEGLFQRYDLSGEVFGPLRARPLTDARLRVDRVLQRASIGLILFDSELRQTGQVNSTFGGPFGASVLSSDGESLFYADYVHGLVDARTSDGSLISATRLPTLTSYFRRSSDGTWLVVVESLDGATSFVTVIDLR
jgi:hypothetical protein